MKEKLTDILSKIDLEIDEIDLYGYDIIETSLAMIHRLQAIINELRQDLQTHIFYAKEDEITFFKKQKPKYLDDYYISIRYIVLKRNVRQEAMK